METNEKNVINLFSPIKEEEKEKEKEKESEEETKIEIVPFKKYY